AFTCDTKDAGILHPAKTPMGIAGSGALFTLLAEHLVDKGKLSLEQLFQLISFNPAHLMGFNPKKPLYRVERLGAPNPVIPSFADTYNPWIDFWSHFELRRTV
ncbi:MAG: dihydroorotase, partial [Candidatus Cloacimonetes bacterium]|nr:dihydroorotase [Candidatus Cloacimonadota bacterium]